MFLSVFFLVIQHNTEPLQRGGEESKMNTLGKQATTK